MTATAEHWVCWPTAVSVVVAQLTLTEVTVAGAGVAGDEGDVGEPLPPHPVAATREPAPTTNRHQRRIEDTLMG
jgi:hypothetical protein